MKTTPRKSSRQTLGPTVGTLLSQKGLTQVHVAQTAGMSPAQISNFLSGRSDIHASTFVDVLNALGIDVLKLIRHEAGLQDEDWSDLSQRLQLLPGIERDTLLPFIREYQKRARQDQSSSSQDPQIA